MTIDKSTTILSVLPYCDLYSNDAYGAVSLLVSESIRNSEFKNQIVLGRNHTSLILPEGQFYGIDLKRSFFKSTSFKYSQACIKVIKNLSQNTLIEIHNRPKVIQYFINATKKIILIFHNDPLTMNGSKLIKERLQLLKQCRAIFFVSRYLLKQFMQGLEQKHDFHNCFVIYYGFDFNKKITTTKKSKEILFVGKLIPEKGALELLKAWNSLSKYHQDWHLTMISPPGKSKKYIQEFKQMIKTMDNSVEHLDFKPHSQIINYFQKAEIACLPSIWHEPFGRVVMEALASSCATISSCHGGIPEIIENAGLLINPTVKNIALALTKLINETNYRKSLQLKAYKQVADKFNLIKTTRQLDSVRHQIIASGSLSLME